MTKVDILKTGRLIGKSTEAKICTKNKYQPSRIEMKKMDPLAVCKLPPATMLPCASCQYEAATMKKPKASVRKIMKKQAFVRTEAIK